MLVIRISEMVSLLWFKMNLTTFLKAKSICALDFRVSHLIAYTWEVVNDEGKRKLTLNITLSKKIDDLVNDVFGLSLRATVVEPRRVGLA